MRDGRKNEIYSLVDEKFLQSFEKKHQEFMRGVYYREYSSFANHYRKKILTEEEFFTNMRRRRVKLYQLCCPFCGSIRICFTDSRWQKDKGFNYCSNCGRDSAINVLLQHLARYIRFSDTVELGLNVKREKNKEVEDWLIGYECYQTQLILLASTIETVFRDYFEALLFIKNIGISNAYIKKSVSKTMGNDFMNIEKANAQYKKAFDIDLKKQIEEAVWNDLVDIVNLRNMVVHNNGRIDKTFLDSASYSRLRNNIHVDLYCLDKRSIKKYFKSVIEATSIITEIYYKRYSSDRQLAIANYYFNASK